MYDADRSMLIMLIVVPKLVLYSHIYECNLRNFNIVMFFTLEFHVLRYSIIPILADIMSEAVKEKVQRIILATYRVSILHQWLCASSLTDLLYGCWICLTPRRHQVLWSDITYRRCLLTEFVREARGDLSEAAECC